MRTLRWLTVMGLMALLLGISAAQLTVTLPNGDANGDNVVDDADLLTVLAGFGTPAADLDGNGITDDSELLLVLSNFGLEGAPAFAGRVETPSGAFSATLSVSLSSWGGGAQLVKVQLKPVGSEDDPDVPIYEFTAEVGATLENVPLRNLPAGVYTVRAFPATAGRWLRTELSEPLTVPGGGGTPAVHIPAPAWAEEVIPTDGVPSGGLGPSSASRVNLASGEYENTPPADIRVRNPKGPDIAFARRYSSYLAKQGYASPGLSLGWVHQYDLRVEGTLGSWGALSLVYPNGARETLTPELPGGVPTGQLIPPAGAPYCAAATPTNQVGRWDRIVIVHRDNSKWIFRPHATGANNRLIYRLANIVDRAGNSVTLSWDTTGRLLTITRSDGQQLLECEYAGGLLRTVKVYDATGAVATRVLLEYTNGLLTRVSQVTDSPTAPPRWIYRYRVIAGIFLLEVVGTQNPAAGAGADTLATHSIGYTPQGVVQLMVDANGHARTYQYNGTTTQVKVYNRESGQVDFQWTQKIGALNVNAGLVDAAQNSSSTTYVNNYLPTAHTNRNGQTSQILYDPYGNVQEVIGPRGNRVVYAYDYPPDYPCSPCAITATEYGSDGTAKLPTRYVFYEQTAPVPGVVGGYAVAGLLAQVIEPKPGVVGGDPNNPNNFVVTNYYYTPQGSLLEVRAPAPNDTPNAVRTTRYFYGFDPFLCFSDSVGERVNAPVAMGVYEGAYNPSSVNDRLLYRESFRYDALSRVVRVIDGLNNEILIAYNPAGQIGRITYPPDSNLVQRQEVYLYSGRGGQLLEQQIHNLRATPTLVQRVILRAGKEGELLGHSGGVQTANFARDAQYRLRGVQDANGNWQSFDFDPRGFLQSHAYPLGDTYAFTYDNDGNPIGRTDPNGVAVEYVRSPIDSRVERINYPDTATDVEVRYDLYNRIVQLSNSVATLDYIYDENDQLVETRTTFNDSSLPLSLRTVSVEYGYHPDGNLRSIRTPIAVRLNPAGQWEYVYNLYTVNYSYDASVTPGELITVGLGWLGTPVRTYYDRRGLPRCQTYAPGLRIDYTFNGRGLLTQQDVRVTDPIFASNPLLAQFSGLTYDAVGRMRSMNIDLYPTGQFSGAVGGAVYTYDAQNRLVREQNSAVVYDHTYLLDGAGNRLNMRGLGFGFNPNNQITNPGYAYDANGNTTLLRGNPFVYDYENRVLSHSNVLFSAYRPDGLRAWKQFSDRRIYFVYDPSGRVLFEFNWSPGATSVEYSAYVYGSEGLALRLVQLGSPPLYYGYVYDPSGSLIAARQRSDTSTYKATRYFWYDAFGQLMATESARSGAPTLIEPMGYLAQYGVYTDREISGTGARSFPQIFLGFTYYDPLTGRLITRSLPDANPYAAFANGTFALTHTLPLTDETLDQYQLLLDVIGVVDPTGLVDLSNAGLYAARGKWDDAAWTAAGIVPYAGNVAKLGKWARRALAPAKKIDAHWGAGEYRHGGLTTTIEHIMYRHGWNSGFRNVSRFSPGTTARDIVVYVDEALRYGQVRQVGGNYEVIHDLGRVIGTDINGRPTSRIKVIIRARDQVIRTAFPF